MRRLKALALALLCLLSLAGCGGETGGENPQPAENPPVEAPPAQDDDVTVYDCGGYQVALPSEYLDLLLVKTDSSGAEDGWTPLLNVYEKASSEASLADYGYEDGFLFGFLSMDQAAFEQCISHDVPGVEIFATDGERYYAYTYPTDVQFYRSGLSGGSELLDHPDWAVWQTLNDLGPLVREDFLTRNNLQTFSVQDLLDQRADAMDYACVRYYPYFIKDGDTRIYYQLLLRQPARQGGGGLWAVYQWLDENGSSSLYFPDSGKPSAEYYAELQEACDAGDHPELLTPAGAAEAFVQDYFGHETAGDSFKQVPEVDWDYMELNEELQRVVLNVMLEQDVSAGELLGCVGEATADNWGVLGRSMYGSDWFQPLMSALSDAAVGGEQQWRDSLILSCLLNTKDAYTDFRVPLDSILQDQKLADPEAFAAALAELSEEDQAYVQSISGVPR